MRHKITTLSFTGKRAILIYLAAFIILPHFGIAQHSDCLNAIPVCSNTYVQSVSASGFGATMEIPVGSTCLSNGETNSTWYIFKIQSAGSLLFQISPLHAQDDYDFVLYNLTGNNCSDILNGNLQPIRCNYSSAPGSTGLQLGVTTTVSNASGQNQSAPLSAAQDETYALMVNNFTSTNSGYTLNFSGSAIIYDTQPPSLTGIQSSNCSPKKITLTFSEDIKCSSVAHNGSDFVVTGPSNVTIASATVNGCGNGVTGTNIQIYFTSKITVAGTYNVKIKTGSDSNTLSDFCDNMIADGTSLTFDVLHIGPGVTIANETDATCTVPGSATANVTGGTPPFTYQWDTNPVQSGIAAQNLAPGAYEIEVTDANGCEATATAHIDLAGMPELTCTKFDVRCDSAFSGEASVQVHGGTPPYQYSWNTNPPQTTQTATGLSVGDYIVTVTTADGCVVQDTVSIPIIGLPDLTASHTNLSCDGLTMGSADVTATGNAPFTYEWSTSPPQYTTQITNLQQGNYTVTVTDAVGCVNTATVHIGQGGMTLTSSAVDLHCATVHDGAATITAADGIPPYHFEWNTNPVQYGATATNLAGGTYLVEVTDAGGCKDTISVNVFSPPAIVINITTTNADCGLSNGSASVTAAGGYGPYTYNWTTLMAQTDTFITGMAAGIYPVEITDTTGCVAEAHAYIANPDGPEGFITDVIDATCDASNGSATVTNVTGNGPFTYMWDTNPLQYSPAATGLGENIFYVMITDVNHCVSFLHVKINRTPKAELALNTSQNASCSHADGSAFVSATGGAMPYQFAWNTNPPQHTDQATGLAAGAYSVYLTDGNGCLDTMEVNILENKAINDFTFSAACIDEPVIFNAITNYSGNASWTWNFGDGTTNTFLNNQGSTHTFADTASYPVTLYINGGCATDTLIKWVKGAYKPAASFAIQSVKYYSAAPVIFTYTGSEVKFYSWNFGDGTESTASSPVHTYETSMDSMLVSLYVTDQNGCMDTASQRIFIDMSPVVYLPNTFTPNGDGLNDYFNVSATGLKNGDMKIFNRWGEEVFSSANVQELVSRGWDGNVKGNPAPEGSYTYLFDATLEDNSAVQYKGMITLLH